MQLARCSLPSVVAGREPLILTAGLTARCESRPPPVSVAQASSVAVDWANTVGGPPSRPLPAAAPPPPFPLEPPSLQFDEPAQDSNDDNQGHYLLEDPTQQPATRHVHVSDLRRVWHAPKPDHSRLTSSISACNSCASLLDIIQINQGYLNPINITAALSRTAWLFRQPAGLRPLDARIGNSQLIPTLIEELRSMMGSLQPRSIATSLHALSTLDVRDRELYADLAHLAEHHMQAFTSQGLGNMLWAFARSGCPPSARWMELCLAVCNNKLSLFSAQDLAMTMWALAKLKYKLGSDKQQRFLDQALQVMPRASPQALTMLAYSLGSMHQDPGQAWMAAYEQQVLSQPGLSKFTPQGVSTTLWAMASLSHTPSPAFIQAISQHLTHTSLQKYSGIDVATAFHALAKLNVQVGEATLNGLRSRFQECMFKMETSQLANSALAMAQMGNSHPQHPPPSYHLLNKLLSAVYMKLHMFNSHDLSMITQALAKLHCRLPATFLATLQQRIEQLGVQFEPQDITLTLWGLQRLGATPSASLMLEFFLATNQRLSSFKPAELSIMIWSLAQAKFRPDKPWVEEFLHSTFPRLPQFSCQGLSNMVLALSMLSIRPTPAWLYAFVKAADANLPSCGVQDLQGFVLGLDAMNAAPHGLQLQKVDEFLDRCKAALELQQLQEQAAQVRAAALQQLPLRQQGVDVHAGVLGDVSGVRSELEWMQAGGAVGGLNGVSVLAAAVAAAGAAKAAKHQQAKRRKNGRSPGAGGGSKHDQQQAVPGAPSVAQGAVAVVGLGKSELKSKRGARRSTPEADAVPAALPSHQSAADAQVNGSTGGMAAADKVNGGTKSALRRRHTAAAVKLAKAAGSLAPGQAALLATSTGVQSAQATPQ